MKTTKLVTFSRPGVVSMLVEIGLLLDETKTLLAKLQGSMLCAQGAAYAAHHRICAACGMLRPLKDRLLHHATVMQIEGSSYRLRQHADLVPEAMRTRPVTTAAQPKRCGRPLKAEVPDPIIG